MIFSVTPYDKITLIVGTSGGLSPSDATTYYFGAMRGFSTVSQQRKLLLPYPCTLIGAEIGAFNGTTSPSSETSSIYIRKNDTTDSLLSSSVVFPAPSAINTYSASGLNVQFAAGDFFEIKWITPTWATNPTAVSIEVVLYFKMNS